MRTKEEEVERLSFLARVFRLTQREFAGVLDAISDRGNAVRAYERDVEEIRARVTTSDARLGRWAA